jgi:hypothetical protein
MNAQYDRQIEVIVMNDYGYGCSVLVKDDVGSEFICTLDSFCSSGEYNDVVCTLDSNRKIPVNIGELSEHERNSCWAVD